MNYKPVQELTHQQCGILQFSWHGLGFGCAIPKSTNEIEIENAVVVPAKALVVVFSFMTNCSSLAIFVVQCNPQSVRTEIVTSTLDLSSMHGRLVNGLSLRTYVLKNKLKLKTIIVVEFLWNLSTSLFIMKCY